MKIYLVGGAVRDQLLGLPPKDNDWVVVGSTPETMLKLGYTPVLSTRSGVIPVFLHPKTKEEHALARCEKKIRSGHAGFEFDISPTLTLIDDLKRRDLTINAMALPFDEGKLGELIDPYKGKADLDNRVLRHVAPTFVEDPLRLFRTARLAACLDFQIASETMDLMKKMVAEKKINELSGEHIWREMDRALMSAHPAKFFEALEKSGANSVLFPSMKRAGVCIKAVQNAADEKSSGPVRFAALMHDSSPDELIKFCKLFNVPRQYRELALLVTQTLSQFRCVPSLKSEDLWRLITKIGAFHHKDRFNDCLRIFVFCTQEFSSVEQVRKAFEAAKSINSKELASKYMGHEITGKIKKIQIEAIQKYLDDSGFTEPKMTF